MRNNFHKSMFVLNIAKLEFIIGILGLLLYSKVLSLAGFLAGFSMVCISLAIGFDTRGGYKWMRRDN